MQPRTIALGLVAAVVALGGVFLLLEVRASGASAPDEVTRPSPRPSATARADHAPRPVPPAVGRPGASPSPRPRGMVPTPSGVERRDVARAAALNVAGRMRAAQEEAGRPVDFDSQMLEANKAYDRHDYDAARNQALKLLEFEPENVRMTRVVVSSSCLMGDAEFAQRYWVKLPEFDRKQMATRCARYDITFTP